MAGYIANRYNHVKIIAASSFATTGILLVFVLAPVWGYLALGNLLMDLVVFQLAFMLSLACVFDLGFNSIPGVDGSRLNVFDFVVAYGMSALRGAQLVLVINRRK